MKIQSIYQKYLIPQNLQQHMLRVGALAKIIAENWIGEEIDKKSLIIACLLHDLAKPVNFSLKSDPRFPMNDEERQGLAKVKKIISEKYGTDEHQAIIGIMQDLGCAKKAIKTVSNMEWDYVSALITKDELEPLIAVYCDMRIGPEGILPVKDRIKDLAQRRKDSDFTRFYLTGQILGKIISENTSINLNLITDQQLEGLFGKLLNNTI